MQLVSGRGHVEFNSQAVNLSCEKFNERLFFFFAGKEKQDCVVCFLYIVIIKSAAMCWVYNEVSTVRAKYVM